MDNESNQNPISTDGNPSVVNTLPPNIDKNVLRIPKITFAALLIFAFLLGGIISIAINYTFFIPNRNIPITIVESQKTIDTAAKKFDEIHTTSASPAPSITMKITSPPISPISSITPLAQLSDTTPKIGQCSVFPANNPWNEDISKLPVNPLSNSYIAAIGVAKSLHPDFGGASSGNSWGIPFITVTNSQKQYPISFTAYGNESDSGPYPIPLNAPVEGGSNSDGDRHVIVVNTDTCKLYELYRGFPTQTGWNADSGAIYDLNTNTLRPAGWTSADAAGLPIFPGLIKYDEVAKSSINHAIRFTTRKTQRGYITPARHFASSSTDSNLPPMGLRVRLKADYNINNLPPQAKTIAAAMKKYGLILADNGGDWFFQGETNKLWNDEDINSLKTIPGSAFEAVMSGKIEN